MCIRDRVRVHVASLQSGLAGRLMAAQPREFAGADALARQAHAEALERAPKLVEFLDLLSGMLANEPALIRLFDRETIAFQPVQGLPNRRGADFQLTRN